MKSLVLKSLCVAACMAASPMVAASELIDDFDIALTPDAIISATAGTTETSGPSPLVGPSYLFDTRTAAITSDAGPAFSLAVFTISSGLAVEFASPDGSGELELMCA